MSHSAENLGKKQQVSGGRPGGTPPTTWLQSAEGPCNCCEPRVMSARVCRPAGMFLESSLSSNICDDISYIRPRPFRPAARSTHTHIQLQLSCPNRKDLPAERSECTAVIFHQTLHNRSQKTNEGRVNVSAERGLSWTQSNVRGPDTVPVLRVAACWGLPSNPCGGLITVAVSKQQRAMRARAAK